MDKIFSELARKTTPALRRDYNIDALETLAVQLTDNELDAVLTTLKSWEQLNNELGQGRTAIMYSLLYNCVVTAAFNTGD